jgi:hypothetical protein
VADSANSNVPENTRIITESHDTSRRKIERQTISDPDVLAFFPIIVGMRVQPVNRDNADEKVSTFERRLTKLTQYQRSLGHEPHASRPCCALSG